MNSRQSSSDDLPLWDILSRVPVTSTTQPDVVSEAVDLPDASSISWADLSAGLPEWVRSQRQPIDIESMARTLSQAEMTSIQLRQDSRIAPPLAEIPVQVHQLVARVVDMRSLINVEPVQTQAEIHPLHRKAEKEISTSNSEANSKPAKTKGALEDVQIISSHQEKKRRAAISTRSLLHELIDQDKTNKQEKPLWVPIEGKLPTLSNLSMEKIEGQIRKLMSLGSLDEIDNDAIIVMQKLLERSLDTDLSASSLDDVIRLQDTEVLLRATTSLRAASLVLLLFQYKPDPHLMSEQVITKVITRLDTIFDSFILPSCRIAGDTISSELRPLFIRLFQQFETCLRAFRVHLGMGRLPEVLVLRTVYLSFGLLTMDTTDDPSVALPESTNMEQVRALGMEIILVTYSLYPEQDSVLKEQLLESLEKVRTDKHSRQYRAKGYAVHIISVLIARLVQLTASRLKLESDDAKNSPPGDDDSRDRLGLLQESHVMKMAATERQAKLIVYKLLSSAEGVSKSASRGESRSQRMLFDKVVEDWLNMKYLIDFPAVPLLLFELVQMLVNEVHRKDSQSSVMALETMEKILTAFYRTGNPQYIDTSSPHEAEATLQIFDRLMTLRRTWTDTKKAYEVFSFIQTDITVKLLPTVGKSDSEIKQRFVQLIDPSTSDSLNGFGTKESQDDALYMEYFRTNRICQSGDVILSSVLQSLEDSRANVKRKALSVLSSLADDHASLIIKSSMLWRLHKLIRDGQAVVKDATLELLSKFLTISVDDEDMASTLRRSVQNAVCTCMSDKSLSVRKRAVKLAPAIARDLENLEMSGGVMYSLLLRDQDDDVGVQDLSRQMLTTILFKRSPSREFVLRVAKVLAAIQSKLSKELINQRDDQLRMYLLRTLNSKGQIPVRESAREIVKVAVEDNLLEPFDEVTDDLLSLLDLVALISQSDGKLVSQDEVIGLADVFMKPDASDKLTKYARHQTFVILQSGLSSHISMSQQFLKNLHATLQKLLTKLSPHDLAEMIPCFWMTAVETDNTVSIARTLVAVLKGLKTETNPQKLVRLIGIAGNIARYCDLENHAKYFMGMDTEVNASSVVDLVIRSVFRFTKEPGTPLSNAAVTIMGAICNSHPKHFANPVVKNSFQRVMCVKGDFAMEDKIKIMESINNYVILESDIANAALVHKTTKSNHLETHVLHGSGTSRPDDAAVKTLLELIFKQVVDLSLDSEGKLAEVAALLLARSLEQGLLSPLKLIHTIICLELSSNDYISRIAIDVHKKLHQTRESKIESFYVDGLQAAADYKRNMRIRQLRGQPLIEGISDKNPLKPLYDIVSQMTKGQRRLFFVKLCRSFTFEPDHATPEELLRHLNYTLFLVRAISLLHLSLADEVLMVLYGIDSLYHASSPVIVHGVEQAGDAVNWQRYGVSSAILLLFWELRRYLREAYKITDEMCIEFSPRSCQMKVEARKSRNQVLNLPFGDYLTTSLAERPIEWYQEMGRNFTNLTLNEDVSTTHAGDSELDESRLADDDGQDEGDEEGESSQRASKRRRN